MLGRGDFIMRWKIKVGPTKKIILVIEGDNRFEGLPVTVHNTAGATYLYPTGKAEFTIKAVK